MKKHAHDWRSLVFTLKRAKTHLREARKEFLYAANDIAQICKAYSTQCMDLETVEQAKHVLAKTLAKWGSLITPFEKTSPFLDWKYFMPQVPTKSHKPRARTRGRSHAKRSSKA